MHLHWAIEDHQCPSYPMSLCVLQYLVPELFFFFVNCGHLRVPFDVSPTSIFASNILFFIDCAGCSADGEALPLSITSPPLFLERLDGAVAKELPKVPQENVGLAFGELPSLSLRLTFGSRCLAVARRDVVSPFVQIPKCEMACLSDGDQWESIGDAPPTFHRRFFVGCETTDTTLFLNS